MAFFVTIVVLWLLFIYVDGCTWIDLKNSKGALRSAFFGSPPEKFLRSPQILYTKHARYLQANYFVIYIP